MTVWLGLPGGEGWVAWALALAALRGFSRVHFSSGCLGVCLSWGGLPFSSSRSSSPVVSRVWGLLPCGSFFCFVSRKSGAAHLVLDSVFIFCTFESFLISAGQSRLFPVSELHDFGVFRFSLTFGRFQRWMLREIGDRYLHDDFQLTRTWHQRFEIVTCMTTFRLHRREVKRFTWIQLLNSFQWGSIQWSFVRQIWLSSHS